MKNFKGIYINLAECVERRRQFKGQLNTLGISGYYERFEAIKGNKDEAKLRGISAGEIGLWKSWMKILEDQKDKKKDYYYIHIAEDDALLSKTFVELIEKVGEEPDWDILATDMYVNPSIYKSWQESHRKLFRENKIGIIKGIYTGCTSSMVIPIQSCDKILELLKKEWITNKNLIPIDNMFVRLSQNKEIRIARSAPFVTSVREESITDSTIQSQLDVNQAIKSTQQICFHLRRQLSVFNKSNDAIQIASEVMKLAKMAGEDIENNIEDQLLADLVQLMEMNKLTRYKHRKNLIGEPLNKQS